LPFTFFAAHAAYALAQDMPIPSALTSCLADLSKHIGSLQEEIDSLRADKNELVKQQAQRAVAERHGYIALNKVEQLEVENDHLSRQINELKAQLYMSSAFEVAEPKKSKSSGARVAWPCPDEDPTKSQASVTKKVNFDQVVPRPEFTDERPPSTDPAAIDSDTCAPGILSEDVNAETLADAAERLKVKRVTTNDVKRELSFKRHERQGDSSPDQSLAASKMNMLKKNPFDGHGHGDFGSRKTLGETWNDAIRHLQTPQEGPLIERVASGVVFKSLAMVAIVANTVYLGWAADHNVQNSWRRLQGQPAEVTSRAADIAFAGWFGAELLIRAAAEKLQFLIGDEKFWNALDVFLVTESLITLAWDLPSSLAFLRILRVFRLVRIVRLVRTVQALRKLRTMIFAMLNSFADLLWALQVVLLIVFVFSLIFQNAVAAHFDSIDGSDSVAVSAAADVNELYGGLYISMVTLWSAVSGGNDWMQYATILKEISMGEFYFILFNFYIAFCVMGLFNVVTGVFVDSAVCTRTEDEIVQGYLDEMKSMTESIKGFLKKADKDSSGTLTYAEFQAHMSNPVVKAYFSGLDIDPDETKIIFTLLDSDCNGDIDIEEFVHGTMKLKGYATKLDVMALMYDATRQSIRFEALCDFVECQMNDILDALTSRG